MKSTITILLSIALLFMNVASVSAGETETRAHIRTVYLSIEGMMTASCTSLVKAAVSKMKGVNKVEASLETKAAMIEFNENITDIEQVQQIIKSQAGFDSRIKL